MKSFDRLREELERIPLIEAPVTAKQWEKVVVAGFNYLQYKDKGNDAVAYDLFRSVKKECKSYVDGIAPYASRGDKMWYCGDEMGKMSKVWTGTNGTLKTDMYLSRSKGNSKVKISLKFPGAQIVSSEKNETLALLNVVNDVYMKNNPDPKLKTLVKEVADGFGSILTKFTTTELKKLAKNPTRIIDAVMQYLELNKMHSILEEKIRSYYSSSTEFRKWFVYEAMSGNAKFAGGLGAANYLLMGDSSGFISMQKLVPTLAAKYAQGLTIGVRFISHKRGRISTSLRGDLQNATVWDHARLFLLSEMNFLTESKIPLNENIISVLLRKLLSYIIEKITQIVNLGIGALLRFLGLAPAEVAVSGATY